MSFFDPLYQDGTYYITGSFHYYRDFLAADLTGDKHHRPEMMGVLAGEAVIPMENQNIVLKSGDMIFIDSDVVHGHLVTQPTKMFCAQLEFTKVPGPVNFGELAQKEPRLHKFLRSPRPYFVFRDTDDIMLTGKQYNRAMELYRDYYAAILLNEMIVKIANVLCEDQYGEGEGMQYIQKVIEFISQNFKMDVSLARAAEYVKLNPSYLSRLFKKQMGMTLTEYCNRYRMNVAKIYLYNLDIPIIDIAEKVGISSRQYFTYLFTKTEGISPQRFRKLISGLGYELKNEH